MINEIDKNELNICEAKLIEVAKQNGIDLTKLMLKQLENYYKFLVEYNENVNLTAITELAEVYEKHFADSLIGAKFFKQNSTICDLGTGAGFPGVVLKIVRPDLNVVLVDSLNKRVDFLNQLIALLKLEGIIAKHNRAEDVDFKEAYLNSFDYLTARAVAKLSTLCEYCIPFVKVGGEFIAYKSVDIDEELADAKKSIQVLGGQLKCINKIVLNSATERNIVEIEKVKETNGKYPRGQNKPRNAPIR